MSGSDNASLAERTGPVTPIPQWLASPDVATVRRLIEDEHDADELADALGLNGRHMRTYSQKEYDRRRRAEKKGSA